MKEHNFIIGNEKRLILIAEDEFINREILGHILESDYEIIYACDGEEALNQIKENKNKLSLVLLDLIMPKINGIDILEHVKKDSILSNIPIIVVTSDALSEEKSLNLGAADFIPKPYPRETVIKARIKRTIELYEDRKIINYTERDPLTRLYNKEYFYQYASTIDTYYEITDALILDIRHFHIINDRFGVHYGDRVLRNVADKLREVINQLDGIVCRKEADTFMIYCPHQDNYSFILDKLKEIDSSIIYRIGIYEYVDKDVDVSIRFDRAKLASDKIRTSINKNIEFYNEKMREKELYEEKLINDFEESLLNNEFKVFYQPKFNVRKDKPYLSSSEALVRWFHHDLGMVSPGDFIPLFEENGLIQRLDKFVWSEVGKQLRNWKEKYDFYVPVSVNVSRIDMYEPDFIDTLLKIIKDNNLTTNDIYLEITESAYTSDSKQMIEIVNKLRDLGFSIEMDDFGTGYSSLNMINELPIDVLKLDMVFVRNAHKNHDTKIVEFIIDIAKYLEVPVIAEGVETKEQVESLKNLGCDIIQGYYFSKPIPSNEFEKFIIERKGINT
ncbi:MAG: EAL domain-containing protein [Acholeplasmatales bacterium]|nr:EAL domain-containing protein [Acholeplasmatales bacterium]